MKKSHVIVAGLGVVLVVLALVDRFVLYPTMHKVPANLSSVVHYDGIASLVNAPAIEAGHFAETLLTGVPIAAEEKVKGAKATDNDMVIADDVVVTGPKSATIAQTHNDWAVSRTTMMNVDAPAGSHADSHAGLVIGFPLAPKPSAYTFWDTATQREYQLDWVQTGTFTGRNAYRYHMLASGPLADPGMLKVLPPALPQPALVALAGQVSGVDTAALSALPAVAPVGYSAKTDLSIWVDSDTGVVLQSSQDQQVLATPDANKGIQLPVTSIKLTTTPDSSKSLANTAATADHIFWALRVGVPWVFGIVGILLIAWVGIRRYRSHAPATEN